MRAARRRQRQGLVGDGASGPRSPLTPPAPDADEGGNGRDFGLEPAVVTIAAGGTTGRTMLTATDDDADERSETLVLYGSVDGAAIPGSLTLTIWDAALPALPALAQLVLAAVLGVGAYRYRRRRW